MGNGVSAKMAPRVVPMKRAGAVTGPPQESQALEIGRCGVKDLVGTNVLLATHSERRDRAAREEGCHIARTVDVLS